MAKVISGKILKAKGEANELEEEVAKALMDIESAQGSELKAELRDFQITAAKEIVCVGGRQNKNAIVLFIPFRVWREARKIVGRLVRELEKKFQKKHVIIVANRTIYDKSFRRKGIAVRPRNRTLTAVHDSILEDVVAPTEIVGKRTRICADGSKLLRISLDKKDKEAAEDKLHVFSAVYRQLTNKEASFDFK
jgi:small subunit ribosomal protein S7e